MLNKVSKITSYNFLKPLSEGTIIDRPNRFIMIVQSNDVVYECHCPSTGRIGSIDFKNIACLFSEQNVHKSRRTKYTVEAISLDNIVKKYKKWIGINQYKVNDYIEHFIDEGLFDDIIPTRYKVRREVKLGKSKIDFLIDDTYLEVKTFLDSIPVNNNVKVNKVRKFISYERISQHYLDLSNCNTSSVLLLCFIYDKEQLNSLFLPFYNDELKKIVTNATKNGVKTWQVNLNMSPTRISFINKYLLTL
jgi:sugar fermentation stimulation protein A